MSGLLLIKLEIGSYVDQVTGFQKALLGPRLLEANLALDTQSNKQQSIKTEKEKDQRQGVPGFARPFRSALG